MKKSNRKKIIIIGGGTAGSIICKRLSSVFNVTVLEQSENKNFPYFCNVPLLIGLLYKQSNQFIKKIDLDFDIGRKVPFFVSNVLGGASVMNGCVHVVGSRVKWDRLLSRFKLTRQDLDNSYDRLFTKSREKNKISIRPAQKNNLDKAFFKALEKLNIPEGDVEWMDSSESGSVYNTVNQIFRSSVKNLNPYKSASVKLNQRVEHLIVDDSLRVIGVSANGAHFFADQVILSGGVIGTNTLLQNKAIRFSDMSFVDLGLSAGEGIQDHTNLRVNVLASQKINSLNEIGSSAFGKIVLSLRHFFGFKTLMMGTGATSAAHLDIDGDGEIDARIQMLNFSEIGRIGNNGDLFSTDQPGFSISITVINPKSCGEIKISSKGAEIKPNYLSNEYDIQHLQKTLFFVINMLESESFKSLVKCVEKADQIKSNSREYILSNSYSGYHLIGGCSHLIDGEFKVSSLKNLYICDASIMNEHVSSNIHSAVAILADIFSTKFINKNSI
jgi:choline dehydrogenase-like flavoprotein